MCQPWHVTDGRRKAIIAAFFANLGIAIAKFIGYLVTRSAGMSAESVHALADTGNQGLLSTELNVRRAVPAARMIYIEPDLHRADHVDSNELQDQEAAAAHGDDHR